VAAVLCHHASTVRRHPACLAGSGDTGGHLDRSAGDDGRL